MSNNQGNSNIFFRFKSQKDSTPLPFDGASLSVFEVKRDIIAISKLGDGTDFDLEIYTPESNERKYFATGFPPETNADIISGYEDDTTQIPRSTTVIARRLPASKPGAGRAARYVTGKMPVTAKNAHRIEATTTKSTPVPNPMACTSGRELTEEEKLNAMLSANSDAWKADQALSANRPPPPRNYHKPNQAVPDKPLPPGYMCHRCGEKGHWIQACPTNNDPNFDGRPKFRRTTGIPRSMLKVVEKPTGVGEDGKIDLSKVPAGVMYTATGEWVVAVEDKKTWEKIQESGKETKVKNAFDEEWEKKARERGVDCGICTKAYEDPVKTPCCGQTYCRKCIEDALLDGDLLCPNCGEQVLLDKLVPDEEMAEKVKAFNAEKKAAKEGVTGKVESPKKAATPPADKSPVNGVAVPANSTSSTSSTPQMGKKRPATEELNNERNAKRPTSSSGTRIPTGPKAQQQQQQQQTTMPQVGVNGNMQDFVKQMQSMASSMPGMQGGMPAGMMNPMMMNGMGGMPFNPMMMGGMNGFNPMMMGMNGMGGMGMGMNGMGGWNNGGQRNGWGNNTAGMQNGGGNGGGAYMRQPVNPHRHRGGQRRQRSVDYKQMGSG